MEQTRFSGPLSRANHDANAVPAIILKMQALYDSLSRSEQKVVKCIIENPEKIIYQSVADLAECSGVSDPTVVRACQRLGLNGYQDLKITLSKDLITPLQAIHEEIYPTDSTQTILGKIFQSTIQTLNFTHDTQNISDLETACNLLLAASKTVILGMGNSSAIAMDLQHKLLRLGFDVNAYSDSHMAAIAISTMKEHDVVFAISHSGSSRAVVDNAAYAKRRNINVISLTNIGISPLSKISDVSLHTASNETRYRIIGLSSRIAQLTIIDTLYTILALRSDPEKVAYMQVESALKPMKY